MLRSTVSHSGDVQTIYNGQIKRGFTDILDDYLKPRNDRYRQDKLVEIKTLENRLAKNPGDTTLQLKIKVARKELDSIITGNTILKMLQTSGSNMNALSDVMVTWLDGDLTSPKQDIQAIANILHNKDQDSQKAALPYIERLLDIMKKGGFNPTDMDATFSKFLTPVKRYEFDKNEGELKEIDDMVIIGEDNQWAFDSDLAKLEHSQFKATKSLAEIESALQINPDDEDLQKQLKDVKATLKTIEDELKIHYNVYGEKKYNDEYEQVQEILDKAVDPVTGDPIDIRGMRKVIQDKIKDLNAHIIPTQDSLITEDILDQIDVLKKELQRMGSIYDNDGTPKTGRDLVIAQTIKEWSKAKQEKKIDDLDYITIQSKARWEQEKEVIDNALIDAETLLASDPLNDDNIENYAFALKDQEVWYRRNTVQKVSSQAYIDRKRITDLIQSIVGVYDKDIANSKALNTLWDEMLDLIKGSRDNDSIIVGTELVPIANLIKAKEEEIEIVKKAIKAAIKAKVPQEAREAINQKWGELSDIQSSELTEYWLYSFKSKLSVIHTKLVSEGKDPALAEGELMNSKWFKDNTIDVTDRYEFPDAEIPPTVYEHNGRMYMPTYQWRRTVFAPVYQLGIQPSFNWKSYRVNKEFINPSYRTVDGSVSVKKGSTKYHNADYVRLSNKEKEFLNEYVPLYEELQRLFPQSLRLGYTFPIRQARGLERVKQRIVNIKRLSLKNILHNTKINLKNLIGLDASTEEFEFGDGKSEEQRDQDRIFIYAKMASQSVLVKRRSKNMFSVMVDYAIEANRYSKMREIKPYMEKALDLIPKKTKSFQQDKKKQLKYSIQKHMNKTIKADKGLQRVLANYVDFNMSAAGFFRLGLPYPTQILKNQLQGSWQIMMSSNLFKGYTQADYKKAYLRAIAKAHDVYMGSVKEGLDKYTAVVRYLGLIPNFNIDDARKQFGSTTFKAVDNARYFLNYFRGAGETQLALTMFEMVKEDYFIDGKSIMDSFSYIDGKLKVTNPALTKNIENDIRNSLFNMNTFVQGNFSRSNAPMIKAYWYGRLATFMSNWWYPAFVRRVGSKRILSTGQEEWGAYQVFFKMMQESPQLLISKNLTLNEKKALQILKYDWIVANAVGLAMYALNLALADDGDDEGEVEEQGNLDLINWSAVVLKKTYKEIGWFNPIETVGSPIKQIAYGKSNSFKSRNELKNLTDYFINNPFQNTIAPGLLPIDFRKAYFGHGERGLTHPWYRKFQDDIITLNLIKTLNFMPEPYYPKSALSGYNFYNPSLYDHIESKEDK